MNDTRSLTINTDPDYSDQAAVLIGKLQASDGNARCKNALVEVAVKHRLDLIVVYGSQASGRSNERSDIDVAVLPAGSGSFDFDAVYCRLAEILNIADVDLVNLRNASSLLAWNVALEGVPIFARESETWNRFRLKAVKRYEDVRRFNRFKLMTIDRFLAEQGYR